MRQIIRGALKEYRDNLLEGSKRVKLHPRTEADVEFLSQILWSASKDGDDKTTKKRYYHGDRYQKVLVWTSLFIIFLTFLLKGGFSL